MRKHFFVLTVSLISMIFFNIHIIDFYHISEWARYFFITPFCYSLLTLFFKGKKEKFLITLLAITCGAVLPILLSTDFANSFWIQKMIMVISGSLFTILIDYKKTSKQ